MNVAKKIEPMTIDHFIRNFEGTRCQFHEGEIWEAQATTFDHSELMGAISEVLRALFNKRGGPRKPGGWWIVPEVAVKYETGSLFSHDLAGWQRQRVPTRPTGFPVSFRPDWVCEILSSNSSNDRITKKAVLHKSEVPYYWIVDPLERSLNVLEWSGKGYISILDVTPGFVGKIPPFDAVDLSANALFGEEDVEGEE